MKFLKTMNLIIITILSVLLLSACSPPVQQMDPLALNDITEAVPHFKRTDGAIYQQGNQDTLYGSSRAHRVGDLLTVHLVEDTSATDNVSSNTNRTSTLKDSYGITPAGSAGTGSLSISGDNKFSGSGDSKQSNKISGDLTVTVIRELPDEKLVVKGYKTISLSNGTEKVGISGVVREEDINTLDNSVNSSQVADAHIAYLSKGDLNTSAQKGWLTRIFSSFFWPV